MLEHQRLRPRRDGGPQAVSPSVAQEAQVSRGGDGAGRPRNLGVLARPHARLAAIDHHDRPRLDALVDRPDRVVWVQPAVRPLFAIVRVRRRQVLHVLDVLDPRLVLIDALLRAATLDLLEQRTDEVVRVRHDTQVHGKRASDFRTVKVHLHELARVAVRDHHS